MHRYRTLLLQHRAAVEASYARVAANLVAFEAMGRTRPLSPIIRAVGGGDAVLRLGDEPSVGLVVFGFDAGQRDEARWVAHRAKLEAHIGRVMYVGNATKVRL